MGSVSFRSFVVSVQVWLSISVGEEETEVDVGEVCTQLELPTVIVEAAVFTISLDAPAQGVIGVPMDMSWSIANNSALLQTVELTLATSQEFLFCGLMQSTVKFSINYIYCGKRIIEVLLHIG